MSDEKKTPTMLIQFCTKEGEPIPVEPSIIAGILLPILGRICETNECDVKVTYGLQTPTNFETISATIEKAGEEE